MIKIKQIWVDLEIQKVLMAYWTADNNIRAHVQQNQFITIMNTFSLQFEWRFSLY